MKVSYVFFLSVGFSSFASLSAQAVISNCESEFYDVTGENGSELVDQMRAQNKARGGFFAYTSYSYKSSCKTLTLKCSVRMPRWVDYATSQNKILKAKWDKFFPQLVAHEQGHVDRFNDAMKAAEEAAAELTCAKAAKLFKTEYTKMAKGQKKYDADTRHGVSTGASFSGANYVGIAYSAKSGSVGFSFDQETQDAAKTRALAECKAKDCKFVQWANGDEMCVSLAVTPKKAYGYAHGKGRSEAEEKTLATCGKFGADCKIKTTVCAGDGKVSD